MRCVMAVVLPFSPVAAPVAVAQPGRRWLGELLVEAGALDEGALPRPGDREAREPGTLQARHAPQNVEDRIETAAVVVEGLREIRPCGDCARRADRPERASPCLAQKVGA